MSGWPLHRELLLVAALSAVCFALGRVLGGTWLQELVDVLATAGIGLSTTDPAPLATQVWWTAGAFAVAGPAGAVSAAAIAAAGQRPRTLPPLLRSVGVMLLGGGLGLGAKAIVLARIAAPDAVQQSLDGEPLQVDLAELAMAPWALAGVVVALGIHLSVGAVVASLGRQQAE